MTRTRSIREALALLRPGLELRDRDTAREFLRQEIEDRDDRFDGRLAVCKSDRCRGLVYWVRNVSGSRSPLVSP